MNFTEGFVRLSRLFDNHRGERGFQETVSLVKLSRGHLAHKVANKSAPWRAEWIINLIIAEEIRDNVFSFPIIGRRRTLRRANATDAKRRDEESP